MKKRKVKKGTDIQTGFMDGWMDITNGKVFLSVLESVSSYTVSYRKVIYP